MAPTDPIVTTVDAAQYRTRQGPCVDAIVEHHTYRTGDLTAETRWLEFISAVADTGIRSILAYRLFVTDTTFGALNLYSRHVDAFGDHTEHDGHLFATHTAIALVGAQNERHLHATIEHRDAIGMAKGILMERRDLDPEQAFRMLIEFSQHTNMKLHRLAAWLVEHRRDL